MDAYTELERLAHPQLTSDIKDIIGFDLGHGDTSIIRVAPVGDTAQILQAVKGLNVIPTAFGTKADGSIVVGEDAFRPDIANAQHQFKSVRVMDPQVSGPLRAFVRGTMRGLRHNNDIIHFDNTTVMVFGCPSAWSYEQRLAYGKLLAEEASDMQTMLVCESRAAFITMKQLGHLHDSEIRDPILIVDLGSSTTDFTFVHDLEPVELPIGSSYPLGAALIERHLVDIALDDCSERDVVETWWKKCPSEYHRTVWSFRQAKEKYFRDTSVYEGGPPLEVTTVYWTDTAAKVKLEADLGPAAFEQALNRSSPTLGERPISWLARLRSDMEAAARYIQEQVGGPPKIVILTGGAARMDFVVEVAKGVFPDPTAVRRAPEPEHAISTGLAFAGSIQYRTQAFLKEVDELVKSTAVEDVLDARMDSLAEIIAEAIGADATERFILPELLMWRNSSQGTLRAVASQVSSRIKTWQESEDGRRHILQALSGWYRLIQDDLHEITAPICMKYRCASDVLDIPKVSLESKDAHVRTDMGEVFIGDGQIIVEAIYGAISIALGMVLFGSGTAILVPTAPIIAGIAAVVVFIIGRKAAKDWAKEQTLDRTIPQFARKMCTESRLRAKLREQAAVTEDNIRAEIAEAIMEEENKAAVVATMSGGIEEALRRRAEEASILIR